MPVTLITYKAAIALFEAIKADADKAGRWMPAVQTMLIQLLARQEEMVERQQKMGIKLREVYTAAQSMANELEQIRQKLGMEAPAAPTAEAPAPAPAAAGHSTVVNGVRVGADGLPLSADAAAIEDMMDAASGDSPTAPVEPLVIPDKPRAPGPPQQQRRAR